MTREPVEILLAEDDPVHAKLAVSALRRHNISNHIKVVEDGAGAVEFLFPDDNRRAGTLRMILLDLGLPKIDGIEVLRRIKGDPRTRNIPVIIMTASRKNSDLQACLELGVNSYIVKPVDFQKFADAVRSLDLQRVLLSDLPNLGIGENAAGFAWLSDVSLSAPNVLRSIQAAGESSCEETRHGRSSTPPVPGVAQMKCPDLWRFS